MVTCLVANCQRIQSMKHFYYGHNFLFNILIIYRMNDEWIQSEGNWIYSTIDEWFGQMNMSKKN